MESSDDEIARAFAEMTDGVELHTTIGSAEAEARALMGDEKYNEIEAYQDALADAQLDQVKAINRLLDAKSNILYVLAAVASRLVK